MSMTPELVRSIKAAALKAQQAKALYRERKIMISECASEMKEYLDYSDDINNMLELIAVLEARDKQIAEDVQIKARLCRESNSLHDRLRDAEKRIAELESRTVKLTKRSVGEVMHMSGFSRDYAEGWCSGNDNARHEIRLVGIALEDNCCAHSSAFLDVSGQRCSLCEAAHIGDEGE